MSLVFVNRQTQAGILVAFIHLSFGNYKKKHPVWRLLASVNSSALAYHYASFVARLILGTIFSC